jgi:formylglycine-generating enzyme required for sulfatase activity
MEGEDGEWLANFRPINQASIQHLEGTLVIDGKEYKDKFYVGTYGGERMGVAGMLNDYADVTAPVFAYGANSMGMYNLAGNVEEMVAEYGITKGGSWFDTGYYLRNDVEETYDAETETTSSRGFRIAMDVIESE